MKIAALSLLLASATAFAPSQHNARSATAVNGGMEDLEAIAAKSNPILKVSWGVV